MHLCSKSLKMKLNPFILSSVATIAVTCIISAAAYYYKSRKIEINEVMVFCKLQFNAYNCFDKLMSYIETAKESVSVCMPTIQNPAIQGRLLEVMKKKNIKVRIIIDRDGYNYLTEFLLKELIDSGAEIKCRRNGAYNLQHKFCLVDDRVLMTGTLNWGNDRSSDQWNYVYITTKTQLVKPVKTEFYQMWNSYMDIQEALIAQRLYDSDQETAELESSESSASNDTPIETVDVPPLKETRITPELLIM